ncbi:MAG: hypothetical protein DSY55_04270 [Clostridia bacterium]|nr:MAG: hypothetical protein DSY55_04270 [Clostridia bacterium]
MTIQGLSIDEAHRTVMWRVEQAAPGRHFSTPWGEIWRGEERGAGLEVWVEAYAAFDLTMETEATIFQEAVLPGLHCFTLTVLDSTDVASS